MSGTVARSNVVPMPANGAPPTTPVPWPQPGMWPMPSGVAGCCPPSNLMQCYCDIQNATAFICAVMVDCINTNPAVTTAIIDAIAKSGSNLPLLGVTNGTPAQPGQVGELVVFASGDISATAGPQTQSITMGVLQPGDWDCWFFGNMLGEAHDLAFSLTPQPAGFQNNLNTVLGVMSPELAETPVSTTTQALISVPTLIVIQAQTNIGAPGPGPFTFALDFIARRRR